METTNSFLAAIRSRTAGQAWFIFYLALAALDLGAVSYTLYQHHRVTNLLDRRSTQDEEFDKQDRVIRRLGSITVEIDDIANDLPNSRDTTESRDRLHVAKSAMAASLTALHVSAATIPADRALMAARVDRIAHELRIVAQAGDDKLAAVERGDLAAAAAQNARLDASNVVAGRLLNELSASIDQLQDRLFAEEHEQVELMRRAQIMIGALIMAIIAGMALYGRALAQRVLSARERDRYVEELRLSNGAFKQLSRKNELILNTAADGIIGIDLDYHLTFLNPAASAMTGFSLEELQGKSIHEALHHTHADGSPYPAMSCPKNSALRSGVAASSSDDTFWKKDGSSFSVEYSMEPMRDEEGRTIGAVVTFRDTTERRAVQRLKDEFVSTVSHELRTPLTSIRGALGLLAGGLITKSPEKAKRMLDIAVSNTDRLVRLINDILDIERIESERAPLTKTRCEASALLRDAVDVMRPMADKAGVNLELMTAVEGTTVWADADRVSQTLTNLLSNAIKFSPSGSTISVSASPGRDGVVFRVADQGRGIPADKLESIFERFQQVDASDSRDKGGTGLGLAICRTIVRQHGGDIRVESVLGDGSVFTFSLPAAAPQQDTHAATPGARVIVCDDEPAVRETLEAMLKQHGYDVRMASGGDELLGLARAFHPDVILLDLVMPAMGGWQAMAALRGDPETTAIPVVIISGMLAQSQEPAPFDTAGWVSKPLDERTLIETLEHALGLGGRNARIMVVEDDFDLARVITASFERHGIETSHAATGREAIEMIREHAPDILILDLILPELDGFGLVEWMGTQEHLRNVPLIVYSAGDTTPAERERLKLGPTQFLTKSRVPPAEFERRVVKLLDVMTLTKDGVAHAA